MAVKQQDVWARFSIDAISFNLKKIKTTDMTHIHGPMLVCKFSSNDFTSEQKCPPIQLPCDTKTATVEGPFTFMARPKKTFFAWPLCTESAGLVVELFARHSADDFGGDGVHPIGSGFIPIHKILKNTTISVDIIEHAVSLERKYGEPEGYVKKRDALLKKTTSHHIDYRGTVTFSGIRALGTIPDVRKSSVFPDINASHDVTKKYNAEIDEYTARINGIFDEYEPNAPEFRNWSVPEYRNTSGFATPSGALPSEMYSDRITEDHLLHLVQCEMECYDMTWDDMMKQCDIWTQAQSDWKDGTFSPSTSRVSAESYDFVNILAHAITSITNTCAYKTDRVVLDHEHVVECERRTPIITYKQAIDCEDGTVENGRVFYEFVRIAGAAVSPKLQKLAFFLAHYRFVQSRMYCGTCHIMSMLVHADIMMEKFENWISTLEDPEEQTRWRRSIEHQVYWPDWMFQGNRRPNIPFRKEASEEPNPLPPFIYLEPTCVGTPVQQSLATRHYTSQREYFELRSNRKLSNAANKYLRENHEYLNSAGAEDTRLAFEVNDHEFSWYQAHVSGSLMSPTLMRLISTGAPPPQWPENDFFDFHFIHNGRYGASHQHVIENGDFSFMPAATVNAKFATKIASAMMMDPPIPAPFLSPNTSRAVQEFKPLESFQTVFSARPREHTAIVRFYPHEQNVCSERLERIAAEDDRIVGMRILRWPVAESTLFDSPDLTEIAPVLDTCGVDIDSIDGVGKWIPKTSVLFHLHQASIKYEAHHDHMRHMLYRHLNSLPLVRTVVEIKVAMDS